MDIDAGGFLLAVPNKSPMGQGQFGPHNSQSPLLTLFASHTFTSFREMSPLSRYSTLFPETDELESEFLWTDDVMGSVFCEETLRSLEEPVTTPDLPFPSLNDNLPPSLEVYHPDPPLFQSGDDERVESIGNVCSMPLSISPEDLYAIHCVSVPID
jgi:hypothetical protein